MTRQEMIKEVMEKNRAAIKMNQIRELTKVESNVIYTSAWGLNPKPHKFYIEGKANNTNQVILDRRAANDKIIRDLKNNNKTEGA